MTPFIIPLAEARERASVGGKAARLGALLRAGLDVPPGFVVTCEAFRRHLEEAGRAGAGPAPTPEPTVVAPAPSVVGAGPAPARPALEATALRERVLAAPLPADVVEPLLAALASLVDGSSPAEAVAVRSSAVAEDLDEASFAGQHDTFLDVRGGAAVLDALRRCWASLWSERAVRYRARQPAAGEPALAVVVQAMAEAEHAGVAFTADPLTGERDRLVVEAVAGLGEALVSGRASADRYVLERPGGRLLEQSVGGALGPPLPPSTLEGLLAAAARAETLFGAPQDVEWAAARGRVVLLQSRPITGLPPAPVALADAEHPVLGYPDRIREMIPSAVTPLLGELAFQVVMPTILEAVSRHGFMPPALAARATEGAHIVRGRLYLDLDMVTSWVAPGLDALAVVELIETGRRPPLSALRMSAVAPLLLKLPAVVFRLLPMLGRLEAASQEVSRILDNIFEELGGDVREWEHGKLVGVLRLQPEATFRERLFAAPPANALARMCGPTAFTALGWMASRWAGEPAGSIAATLVAGEPRMPEVQCAIALWDLAEAARAVPAVAQALATDPATALERLPDDPAAAAWRRRFDEFLARFGHRAIEEVELGRPRWRERPAYPLSVIAGYLRGSAEASPRAVQARRHREREAAEARVLARLRRRPLRRFLFRRALVAARETALASESSKSDIMRLFWLWRVAALELGRRLAAAGRLEAAEDVFFLHLDELEDDGPDLRATVAARREDHGRWQREQPPRLLDARGRGVREGLHRRAALADGALAGTPTSPGLARGPVRVVLDPAGGVDLAPGDVLVAPFTDPAWTPLFYTAVAAVVEVGSLLSHASIVAREAGIPSVVGIPGVTSLLRDGERVEVDGTRGTVRFLDRIGAEPA